ncbi:hypothetical protein B566_EDAN001202 [Ephemera danica]|nr:hypothetical protein B566_EDAN001202 [Ephemera danica]
MSDRVHRPPTRINQPTTTRTSSILRQEMPKSLLRHFALILYNCSELKLGGVQREQSCELEWMWRDLGAELLDRDFDHGQQLRNSLTCDLLLDELPKCLPDTCNQTSLLLAFCVRHEAWNLLDVASSCFVNILTAIFWLGKAHALNCISRDIELGGGKGRFWLGVADLVHDDIPAVQQNRDVLGLTPIHEVFINDFWGTNMGDPSSHKSYRPLTVLSFSVPKYLKYEKKNGASSYYPSRCCSMIMIEVRRKMDDPHVTSADISRDDVTTTPQLIGILQQKQVEVTEPLTLRPYCGLRIVSLEICLKLEWGSVFYRASGIYCCVEVSTVLTLVVCASRSAQDH